MLNEYVVRNYLDRYYYEATNSWMLHLADATKYNLTECSYVMQKLVQKNVLGLAIIPIAKVNYLGVKEKLDRSQILNIVITKFTFEDAINSYEKYSTNENYFSNMNNAELKRFITENKENIADIFLDNINWVDCFNSIMRVYGEK